MDLVTEIPGLHHLAEKIFSVLEDEKLLMCQKVNDFWKRILDNPMFWLKKCLKQGLPKEYHLEWTKLIHHPKDPDVEENVTSYLRNMYETKTFISPIHTAFIFQDSEIIKIMARLSKNPNAPFPPNEKHFGCSFCGVVHILHQFKEQLFTDM